MMTKGARIYCEGRIEISEWSGQDGAQRHGLSCLSWHTRLAQIGRHKPKREPRNGTKKHSEIDPPLNDFIGFLRRHRRCVAEKTREPKTTISLAGGRGGTLQIYFKTASPQIQPQP